MAKIPTTEIVAVASFAGFTGERLAMAVAVALAESSGDTMAVGTNRDGSKDRGLWQINNRWHPEVSDAAAFDPQMAAIAAHKISNAGSNWKPWATYPTAANARLPQALAAVAAWDAAGRPKSSSTDKITGMVGGKILGPVEALGAVTAPLDAMGQIAGAIGKAAAWIGDPHNLLRIVWVVGGSVAILAGIVLLGLTSAGGPIPPVARAATKAVKAVN